MKKKLALIVLEEKTKSNYVRQLEEFFGDKIEIQAYAIDVDKITDIVHADLFLVSLPEAAMQVAEYIPANAQISYVNRTFDSEKVDQLSEFEDGTGIMVFDYKQKYALETMAVLNQVGYGNLHFIAASFENMPEPFSETVIAVTVSGEIPVPQFIRKVIIIGWYRISVLTYADVIEKLGIEDEFLNRRLYEYSKKLKMTNSGLSSVYQHMWKLQNQWEMIIDMLDNGIILTDANYNLLFFNSFTSTLLGPIDSRYCLSENLFPLTGTDFESDGSFQNRLFELKNSGKKIVASKRPVFIYDELQGYLFLLRDAKDIQKIEHKIRIGQNKKGFEAKYTFDRILTGNNQMRRWIAIGKKVAPTGYAVLITGESGVGKELFAQSIHNASRRREMPFVAVNCASLPAGLLESELFGYEEGAFTGAKKGGKKGLFEMAHQGTLFLDEIGEMPVQLQANLLRVLQEKEVMRLGGDTVIPVDVRIIAASNADFIKLIREKKFRLDLYYRLKTIHISLPNLNDRPEDIPLLCRRHIASSGPTAGWKMEEALTDRLRHIRWHGNVRELFSCIDYMLIVGSNPLALGDLPLEYQSQIPGTKETAGQLLSEEILALLNTGPMGRRSLTRSIRALGYDVTEYQIRKLMNQLEEQGKIKIGSDKKGSRILPDLF